VHTERWPNAQLHSSFSDRTDLDMASDTGACDHKHAVGQSRIRSRGKSVQCQPIIEAKLDHRSGSVMKTLTDPVNEWVSSEANDIWHSKRCGCSARVIFQLLIGWRACHLSVRSGGSWIPMKWRWMSHMADKRATPH